MKIQELLRTSLILCAATCLQTARAEPPFNGTIFVHPDIITDEDPTAFRELTDAGRGERRMFDRREDDFIVANAFLFTAHFEEGREIEVQVNPEFGTVEAAREQALRFAPAIGQIPAAVREDVETVWIHEGMELFGGGNNNILIHTGQADAYIADGILAEVFVHEGCHASLDGDHARAVDWIAAQQADPEFISTYAREHPMREDIAESFLLYLAVRYHPDRIPASLAQSISQTMPHRIAYFDQQMLDMHPFKERTPFVDKSFVYDPGQQTWDLSWKSEWAKTYAIEVSKDRMTWNKVAAGIVAEGLTTTFAAPNPFPEDQVFLRVREMPRTLPE